MNHIAAALLLSLGGKKIDKQGLTDVVTSCGGKVNATLIENIIGATSGKTPEKV